MGAWGALRILGSASGQIDRTVDAFENIDASSALKRGFELQDLWRALFRGILRREGC